MKRKCLYSILLILSMLCTCLTGAVAEEQRKIFTDDDYQYAVLDDVSVEIVKYNGKAKKLTIPDMLDGKEVIALDNHAFSACSSLLSVSIPDSVVQINENPFSGCRNLKVIFISPEHPYYAVIDNVLFRKSDKTLVSYPAGKNMSTYCIPQGTVAIGNRAFAYCKSLTSIEIPDSVSFIGKGAFLDCSNLTSFSLSPNHPYLAVIDDVLFRKADKALISYPAGKETSTYYIPQGIAIIDDYAFFSCTTLSFISIPDSISTIGNFAFSSCSSLTSISIPDSVTFIGEHSFSYCSALTSVSLSNSMTTISDNSFSWCKSLIAIFIPNSIVIIGNWTFSGCKSLSSVVIPDSVAEIGEYAFSGCDALTSISLPNSVTAIGKNAFHGCPTLTLTVLRNSYSLNYAENNNIPYTYPDANDWLNN